MSLPFHGFRCPVRRFHSTYLQSIPRAPVGRFCEAAKTKDADSQNRVCEMPHCLICCGNRPTTPRPTDTVGGVCSRELHPDDFGAARGPSRWTMGRISASRFTRLWRRRRRPRARGCNDNPTADRLSIRKHSTVTVSDSRRVATRFHTVSRDSNPTPAENIAHLHRAITRRWHRPCERTAEQPKTEVG
jgi:hypothetical protein